MKLTDDNENHPSNRRLALLFWRWRELQNGSRDGVGLRVIRGNVGLGLFNERKEMSELTRIKEKGRQAFFNALKELDRDKPRRKVIMRWMREFNRWSLKMNRYVNLNPPT